MTKAKEQCEGWAGRILVAGAAAAAVMASVLVGGRVGSAQEGGGPAGLSVDLPGALRAIDGCLGVETAKTASGKNVIFAWFENREACLRWYYSDLHQGLMNRFFPAKAERREPLSGVPEDYDGPLMAIASITYTDGQGAFEGVDLPISQIAIELYRPMTGGLYLGGRFAPDAMKLPSTEDVEGDYSGDAERGHSGGGR